MNPKLRDHVEGFVNSQLRDWEGYIGLIARMAEGWAANHGYASSSSDGSRSKNWQRGSAGAQQAQRTTSEGGNAMDIDKSPLWTGKRAKWVSDEEVRRRRDNRLCLRCGGSGNMNGSCPLLPAMPPNGARVAVGHRSGTISVPDGAWEDVSGNE